MQCLVYIATSLDGYIAGPQGEIDWLHNYPPPLPEEGDYGYGTFMDSVGALVMGKNSFEKVMTFDSWPYEGKRVIVVSRSLAKNDSRLEGRAELFSGTISQLLEKLEAEGLGRLYIDGGKLIQSFLADGKISEMTITTVPILLGNGLRLFGELAGPVELKLLDSRAFVSGMVQHHYRCNYLNPS